MPIQASKMVIPRIYPSIFALDFEGGFRRKRVNYKVVVAMRTILVTKSGVNRQKLKHSPLGRIAVPLVKIFDFFSEALFAFLACECLAIGASIRFYSGELRPADETFY